MKLKERFNLFLVFISLNLILSLFLNLSYIFLSKKVFIEYIYLFFQLISNTFMIYIALFLVGSLIILIPFSLYILVVFFSLFQVTNIVDIVLYKFWQFHINSMVINLIFTPGGLDTLNQSWSVRGYFITLLIFILIIEYFIYKLSKKTLIKLRLRAYLKIILMLSIISVFVDKITFAISSLYDYTVITKNISLFPLYQPLTIRSFASEYLGFNLNKKLNLEVNIKSTNLNYPKKEIKFKNNKNYNIIIIVVDSMRYDMFDKDIMPYTYELSKKSVVFKNHYSGGNCTRFGIFSILYGLYGNYWFNMIGEKKGPVLLDVMEKKGYDLRVFASAKITFPEFNKTCFVKVNEKNVYDLGGNVSGDIRDKDITDKFIEYINNKKDKRPYFSFVFYDASHGSFDYPVEFEKFKPSHGVNLFKLNKDNIKPLFNKYKNSVHYDDYLVERIIKAIKDKGDLKNTIIIITGDHGEAFLERGYTGHNHSYSYEEVKVPLIFYHPDFKPKEIDYKTSHFDIAPTLMDILGVLNSYSDYSHGKSLFVNNNYYYMPVFTWDNSGLVFDTYTIVVPFTTTGGNVKQYVNDSWQEVSVDYKTLMPYIMDFKKKLSEFLKK